MRASKFLASGAVLAMLAAPLAARADLTADQVWQDWQDLAAASGQSLTAGATDRGPGRITLSQVQVVARGTEDRRATVTVPRIEFLETSGDVAIDLSPDYTAVIETRPAPGAGPVAGPERMTVGIAHPGLAMTASGAPGDVTYSYTAPALTLDLRRIERGGAPVTDHDFEVTARSLAGRTRLTGEGAARRQDQEVRINAATATFSLTGDDGDTAQGSVRLRDVTATSSMALDGPAAGAGPLDGQGNLSFGALDAQFDSGTTGPVTVTLGPGRNSTSAQDGILAFESEAADGRIALPGRDGTAPIDLAFARLASTSRLPSEIRAAPQDAALSLSLDRLTASESLWSLVDPNRVFPRDPANLLLDLGGRMRWLVDPSDPAAMEAGGRIADVEALTVNDIDLGLAGARLTGRGDFTFPDTPGEDIPRPVGRLDLALSGGNALLDRLAQIGVIPNEQAMMVRMLVAGFTRPGEGPDSIVSTLDFGPGGSISANGRPLR